LSITGRDLDDVAVLESRLTVPLAFDPAPLPFAGSSPDAVPLPVLDCVIETSLQDRAAAWVVRMGSETDALGLLDLRVVVLVLGVEQVSG
jgi:hypothetical protein